METEHSETVVEKAIAYVKDMFGVQPVDKASDGEANRVVRMTPQEAGLTPEDARLDPHSSAFNKIVEPSRHTSMDTEHENTAADAHMDAVEKIDHAEGSVRKALDDIQDVSRDMREKIVDEKNPSYNGTIKDVTDRMNDYKKLPADSEMQEAVERVRDADNEEKSRQAEEQSDWRSAVQ